MTKMNKGYLVGGAIMLALFGLFVYRISDKFVQAAPVEAPRAIPVEVFIAKPTTIETILLLTGNAEPEETVILSTKRGNLITGIYAKENQRVSQGQLLVKLDHSDLQAQVAVAYAQVATSSANVAQVKTQLDHALTELNRMRSLFAQGAVSQQQLDSAQTQYKSLNAQYQAALASAQASSSNVSYLAALKDDTSLRAPFNGLVISKQAEQGEVVDGGKPILIIGKIDRMKIKARISEMEVSKIHPGQEVKVLVDALPAKQFSGIILQILPQVDLQSRSLIAEILIPNPDFAIKPAMFSRSLITTAKHENTIVIPKAAVIYQNEKPYLYLAVNNKSQLIPVALGITQGEKVEVLRGVKAGDKVITAGQDVIDNHVLLDIRKVGE